MSCLVAVSILFVVLIVGGLSLGVVGYVAGRSDGWMAAREDWP